ncbi:putative ABC transport system permease protein [Alkalispirillum mobile]|uniref:Putative ABC transport system permease protein n=1 Tax=Alkalispirillum mobile TaxID=85925 RepID=A0A498C7V9_9GAMM|nr:FtsX-like permease family protein [Alkalispirillum mobile]RLK48341.1 putative ABC transport system permease protein [Alkalispirillum mobile]
MSAWRQALRLLWRDGRAGELRLLLAAVIIAVAAVSGVAWLADRVSQATDVRAAELLGGDRVVRSNDPIPEDWVDQARDYGLQTVRSAEFPSVVVAGEYTQLVSLKAVESGYPLRGSLQLRDEPEGPLSAVQQPPEPGAAWIAPRLLPLLEMDVGDTLEVGARALDTERLIALEPDRGGGFFNLAPRVLIHWDDLEGTGLVQEGSRIRYRLMLAGEPADLARYEAWLTDHAPEAELQAPGEGDPALSSVMEQAQRFLGLAALLTVVVAGVAILLTARHYASRQIDRIAIMRCLGATQRQVTAILTWKLLWLGLLAGLIGTALGYGLHLGMVALLADYLPDDLAGAGPLPALTGTLVALSALLGFALPSLLRLRDVPPLRVLRRDAGSGVLRGWLPYPVALAVIFGLMWWQGGDLRLAAAVFGAVMAGLAALGAIAAAVVYGLRRTRRARITTLSGLVRRPATATLQIVAVGLGLTALLLLSVVREDLLATWERGVDPEAPNYFLINVQPDEVDELERFLADRAGVSAELYPMIRGRLVGMNGEALDPEDYAEPRTRRLVAREFNLSHTDNLPDDNRVIRGRWFDERQADRPQWSVEEDIAQRIGVDVGDTLTYRISGREVTGEVTSIRRVQWDSFNANFFVIGNPGLLADAPTTYITSFHLPEGEARVIADLVRQFPSVTPVDLGAILEAVRDIIRQGSRVVELMATLTLVAGVLVLLAALQITGDQRRFETALMRSLGASRAHIRRMARREFLLLGALSGGLAGVAAGLAGWGAAGPLFDLDYQFNPWLPALGVAGGAVLVWAAGALATRDHYRQSPMTLLRDPDD